MIVEKSKVRVRVLLVWLGRRPAAWPHHLHRAVVGSVCATHSLLDAAGGIAQEVKLVLALQMVRILALSSLGLPRHVDEVLVHVVCAKHSV